MPVGFILVCFIHLTFLAKILKKRKTDEADRADRRRVSAGQDKSDAIPSSPSTSPVVLATGLNIYAGYPTRDFGSVSTVEVDEDMKMRWNKG
jgi:hypothetical protein